MLATQIEVSDGTLTTLNVGIEFFAQADISVYLDQAVSPLLVGAGYQWVAANTIQFLDTLVTPGGIVPAGVTVTLRRNTQNDEMYNLYDGGAPFNRTSLDENFEQLLRLSQEFSEGLGIDGLRNNLNMHGYRITELGDGIDRDDAANVGQVQDAVAVEAAARATADAALQDQLLGTSPPAGSQFSVVSWHGQVLATSVNIPANVNAWSFGPTITIATGQVVTIGEGSFWTIANGATTGDGVLTAEIPAPLDFGTV